MVTSDTLVALQRALELAPHEPMTHYIAGIVAVFQGDLGGAERANLKALALHPHMEIAQVNLAEVRLRQGATGAAAAGFAAIFAENPASGNGKRGVSETITAVVSSARIILTAGVVGSTFLQLGATPQEAGPLGWSSASHVATVAIAAAVGLAWIMLGVRFAYGAGAQLRHVLRAAWRLDRPLCWIVVAMLVMYALLVMAALPSPSSVSTPIVLFLDAVLTVPCSSGAHWAVS